MSYLSRRKGAGFTFSNTQLIEFASKLAGRPIAQRITALDIVHRRQEDGNIGVMFHHIFLPEGMDTDKEHDDKRRWMLILAIKDLEPTETHHKFTDIPFDKHDPNLAKGFDWITSFGYTETEVKDRWMTVSSWSVGED